MFIIVATVRSCTMTIMYVKYTYFQRCDYPPPGGNYVFALVVGLILSVRTCQKIGLVSIGWPEVRKWVSGQK